MTVRIRRVAATFVLAVVVALAGVAYVATAQSPPSGEARTFGKANAKTIDAYVCLLRLRHDLYLKWKETGKWPDDKEANAALAAHGEYWAKQLKDGRSILAGGMKGDYWDNVALIIFEAPSEAEAQKIVKEDPAVKSYVFQAQVRPFDVSSLTNKYR